MSAPGFQAGRGATGSALAAGASGSALQALRGAAEQWLSQGREAELIEVTATQGSVPREAGTRMLVSAHEALGTIGGGHLELAAIALARERLARGERSPHDSRHPLGPALGQCCGGVVWLRHQRLDAAALQAWSEPPPRFFLQLYGAGHVGRAIAGLLATLPCRVQWIDEREEQFPAGLALPPHIERVCVEPVQAEVDTAPPGAHLLVLTHSHDLDYAIVEAALKRGNFAFLGLIGSRTKRARFEHRLLARGFTESQLARLTCPIGIEGLASKEPEVVAVSAVAQLLRLTSGPPA
ncbi:MAG: xanthine dehydrogenase accessory protein XdhC [Rubrivivax sp.]